MSARKPKVIKILPIKVPTLAQLIQLIKKLGDLGKPNTQPPKQP